MQKTANIKRLKQFAVNNLPLNHPLRDILLAERDEMKAEEIAYKTDIWMNLFKKGI